jgi:hypothetical protein
LLSFLSLFFSFRSFSRLMDRRRRRSSGDDFRFFFCRDLKKADIKK